jgi:predicted outer membrane repeat protein
MTIDGLGRGNTNYRFVGVGYWNSGGDLINVRITGVRDTPFSGAQHGVGVYSYNNTGGPYNINLTDVDAENIQKTAYALSGDGLTVNVNNCTAVGAGPTDVTAQNGIQIGYGATGSVTNCDVSGMWYTGPSWSASGIMFYYPAAGAVMTGSDITDCQGGLNAYFADGLSMDGCLFDDNDFEFVWGGDGINILNNTFTDNSEALYISDATNLNSTGNIFDGNSTAVVVDGLADNVTFNENDLINSSAVGLVVQPYLTDEPDNVNVSNNNISGNAFGLSNTTSNMVNAAGNWWGDVTGPDTGTVVLLSDIYERPVQAGIFTEGDLAPIVSLVKNAKPDHSKAVSLEKTKKDETITLVGDGDKVSTMVDYSPWWGANYVGDSHTESWTWYLDQSNSSSIQEGIDLVSTADTLKVKPDTYKGVGNRAIDFSGKDFVLLADDLIENCIIDCENLGRAFYFHSGETVGAVVEGFTIINGYTAFNGGAFLIESSSSPCIRFCLVTTNHAVGNGGAFFVDNSNPNLRNNTVIYNVAGGSGGGIYVESGAPIVINSILWDDTSATGDEIAVNSGTPAITFCDVQGGWPDVGNIDCNPRFCNPEEQDFYISDISCCLNAGYGGVSMGAFPIGCTGDFLPGDVNADGSVNGLDVIYFINYLKDIGPPIPEPILRADANGNCMVNGVDVVYLVAYFKGGPAPIRGDCPFVLNNRTKGGLKN